MSTDRMVHVDGLTKEYEGVAVVDGVSFEIGRSCIFGLLGPNGAGKTSIVRMLMGLVPPTRGRIAILGTDFTRHPSSIKRRIGHVGSNMAFYNQLTGPQNLRFFGAFYGMRRSRLRARIEDVLRFVGLWEERSKPVGCFSTGMKQRLAIAKALLHDPEILLLDEATNGVDVEGARDIRELLYELRAEGRTSLVASHRLDEIELLCDRIALLDKGRLIEEGGPAAIRASLHGLLFKYVVKTDTRDPRWDVEPVWHAHRISDGYAILATADMSQLLAKWHGDEQIELLSPTFEEGRLWLLEKERLRIGDTGSTPTSEDAASRSTE